MSHLHLSVSPSSRLVCPVFLALALVASSSFAATPVATCGPASPGYKDCVLDLGTVQVTGRNVDVNDSSSYHWQYANGYGTLDLSKVGVGQQGASIIANAYLLGQHFGGPYGQTTLRSGLIIQNLSFKPAPGQVLESVMATVSGTVKLLGSTSLSMWGNVDEQRYDFVGVPQGDWRTFAFSITGAVPLKPSASGSGHDALLSIQWEGFAVPTPGNPDDISFFNAGIVEVDSLSLTAVTAALSEPELSLLIVDGLAVVAGRMRGRMARGSKMAG